MRPADVGCRTKPNTWKGNNMKKSIILLAVVASLGAGAANAANDTLTMLEQSVTADFKRLGIKDVMMGDLTLSQLALIKAIMDDDESMGGKKTRIEFVINR
jgi:type II secretory pathway predicted ATPase ExeA